MKILMTGTSGGQCGRRSGFAYVPSFVASRLRVMGHEVDHRDAPADLNLDQYDRILVGLFPPGGFGMMRPFLRSLRCAVHPRCTTVYFDDWQVDGTRKALRTLAEKWDTAIHRTTMNWKTVEEEPVYYKPEERDALVTDAARDACAKLSSKVLIDRWRGAFAMFKGPVNKMGLVAPFQEILPYDITGGMPEAYAPVAWKDKSKTWLAATVHDWTRDLKRAQEEWPIVVVGRDKKERIPFENVEREYSAHWGNLLPKYEISGTGWYRCRYVFSARARSICISDRSDMEFMGHMPLTVREVERMSGTDLRVAAEQQTVATMNRCATTQESDAMIAALVER